MTIKPRIGVSKCLEFGACRFDGQQLTSKVVRLLDKYVDFVPVCPEVEIGLGIPRPTIRLEGNPEKIDLVQPETGKVLTKEMQDFSRSWLSGAGTLDGFILKSRSPSCGLSGVKIHPKGVKGSSTGKSGGLFAIEVSKAYSDIPLEDEGRLTNAEIREHFLMNIYTRAKFRQVIDDGSMKGLVDFHTRSKYLFMTLNQSALRDLGKITANPDRKSPSEVISNYGAQLHRVFYRLPSRGAAVNTMMHTFGYVSDQLNAGEKAFFIDLLENYIRKRVELGAIISVMKGYVIRFNQAYLLNQTVFDPFPAEFLELDDTGKGRQL